MLARILQPNYTHALIENLSGDPSPRRRRGGKKGATGEPIEWRKFLDKPIPFYGIGSLTGYSVTRKVTNCSALALGLAMTAPGAYTTCKGSLACTSIIVLDDCTRGNRAKDI